MSENIEQVQTIGRYTILGKIGAGGMAEVFLAKALGAGGTEKILVLKKIHPVLAKNDRFIDMFVEEARVAMRLNHTNIVQVYAFEQIDNDYLLAMEHVDGCDLHEIQTFAYAQGYRIPWGLCAYITWEIAKGLDYSHSRKDDRGVPLELVHRDVSPQNVLISNDGAVKVTDFGIVKAKSVNEELGEVKGKLGYMSPQQARGLSVDRRADVYSLGVVLHELLVGASAEKPVLGEAVVLPPPIEIDASVPKGLNDVALKALASEPADRYQTAREMAADLSSFLHDEKEIYDAQTLETWIAETIPKEKRQKVVLTQEQSQLSEDLTNTLAGQTISLGGIGEVENQAVVMVSVNLSISPHPERATIHAEVNRLAAEIAYKNGGILREFSEGFRVFIGLPRSALEDAITGIRLAHDLIDVVRTLAIDNRIEMQARITVNRGQVTLQKTKMAEQAHFEPEKSLVQVAQRLFKVCPIGDIIAGNGVYRLARNDYNFEGPLSIATSVTDTDDGSDDLYGYRVRKAKSRIERKISDEKDTSIFLGRDLELSRMQDAYERSMGGNPVILKVEGELGIGKSRFVRHFLEGIKDREPGIIKAECLFAERDTPLAAGVAAIRAILNFNETDPLDDLPKALQTIFAGAPNYWERQRTFYEQLLASPDLMWARAHEKRRELIMKVAYGLGALLSQAAHSDGAILVIDNAQWLDGPSVDVLSELASNLTAIPVLVVLVGQPETLNGRRIENMERLEISDLSPQVMQEIIAQKLGDNRDIREISAQILERSHGHPFFANEIIESLIERKILEQSEDSNTPNYKQARPGAIRLPSTLEGIAASRIDSLHAAQRTTLRAASAIGASLNSATLQSLVGRNVQEDIAGLVESRFLVEMPPGPDSKVTYRFQKPMEREAAYSGLSKQDKLRIHKNVARMLSMEQEEGIPVPASRIAWHLDRSGQAEKAAVFYLKAGDAAMKEYSNRRALRAIDRALSLLPLGSRQRYDALTMKERVVMDLGLHNDHLDAIREMEDLGNRFDDDFMQANTAYRYARYEFHKGNFKESAIRVQKALSHGKLADDKRIQVEALGCLGYVAIEEGKLNEAMNCCNWALSLVSNDEKDLYLRGRVLGFRGLVLMEMGKINAAPASFAKALVIFQKLGDRRNESTQLRNLGILSKARGNLIESIEFLEHAIAIDREIRDVSERGRKLVAVADVRVEMGQFDVGEELLEEALRICRKNAEPMGEIEAELGQAELLLQKGDPVAAREILLDLLTKNMLENSRLAITRHRQLLAQMYLETGEYEKAKDAADEATIFAQNAQMSAEVIHGASLRGLAFGCLGRFEEALAATDRLEELIDDLGGVRHAESVWWCHARTMKLAGEHKLAEISWQKARIEIDRKSRFIIHPKHLNRYLSHPKILIILQGFSRQSDR